MKLGEEPIKVAMELGTVTGVQITPTDIDVAHRLATRNKMLPPPLIIRFVNRWKRDQVMSSIKEIKPTTEKLGGKKDMKIFCHEHLTSHNQKILLHALKLKEKYSIWSNRGKVMWQELVENSKIFQLLDLSITCWRYHAATKMRVKQRIVTKQARRGHGRS